MAQTAPARVMNPAARKLRRTGWILLILLAAAAFRLVALSSAPSGMTGVPPGMTGVPPGMTHDEADHGLTAWAIVNGARKIYFTISYGREPLYDYATALVMAGTGPMILAARLTSVYFSLLMIAAVYAWARRAFGEPVALLSAAGLAVGFWPVMAGRQALRSIALPAVFSLAVLFFWQGFVAERQGRKGEGGKGRKGAPLQPFFSSPLRLFSLAGLLLGLSFYTYIPARVLWLAFPVLAIYLALAAMPDANRIRPIFQGTVLTLVVALLVAAPLLFYLADNPGVEVRIDELSAPLAAAAAGDFAPLWVNALGALKLFTVEGDQTWRYNIPGKPFLGPVMGVLFYVGLLVAGWLAVRGLRNRVFSDRLNFYQPASGPGAFLAFVWLALGMAPVLITGPGLSVTQAIGALPVLYVFPALALAAGWHALTGLTADGRRPTAEQMANDDLRMTGSAPATRHSPHSRRSAFGGLLIAITMFAFLAVQTARDYFGRWANEPEVRVQYEATMVAALRYLDEHGRGAAAVSTITPGRYHTPAVALLTLHNPDVQPRWFDGRQSLLFPAEAAGLMLIPGFTPIPAALQPYLDGATLIDELPMRPDDLDRPVRVYDLPADSEAGLGAMKTADLPVRFGEHIELLGYDLSATEARPGDTLALVTVWRFLQPLPDASLFAHIVGPGEPPAVADSLGAPGESWVAGDVLFQLHTLVLPVDIAAGEYPVAVGVYTRGEGRRLVASDGQDRMTLTTLAVSAEAGDE